MLQEVFGTWNTILQSLDQLKRRISHQNYLILKHAKKKHLPCEFWFGRRQFRADCEFWENVIQYLHLAGERLSLYQLNICKNKQNKNNWKQLSEFVRYVYDEYNFRTLCWNHRQQLVTILLLKIRNLLELWLRWIMHIHCR